MTKPLALVFYDSLLPGSLLTNRMQDLGYRVIPSTELSTLLAQAKDTKPFVMVVDLTSENPDLYRLLRDLRGTRETEHVPVLAFAKDGQEEVRKTALSAGATLVTGAAGILTHLPQLLAQVLEVEP